MDRSPVRLRLRAPLGSSNLAILRRALWALLPLAWVLTTSFAPPVHAADVFWDVDENGANNQGNGTGLGGTGLWNTTNSQWWPGQGTLDQIWNNAANDTAVFSGTPGTVTLNEAITAGGLKFLTDGYTINGGFPLTLNGSASALPTVTVQNAGDLATIQTAFILGNNAVFTGAGNLTLNTGSISGGFGFAKLGSGTLTLGGSNTFSGPVAIRQGVVSISAADNLGDGSVTNTLTLAGGGTLQANGSFNLGACRGPILGIGGGTVDVTGSNNLTMNGNLSVSTGVATNVEFMTKIGTGTLTLTGTNSAATLGVLVNGGTLSFGAAGNLGTSYIGLNGGTLRNTTTASIANQIRLIGSGGTISVDPSQTLTTTSAVIGPGSLTKAGNGTLQLNVVSTYAGSTTVNAGTLQNGIANSLPTATALTVNSGGTVNLNALAMNIGSLSGAGIITNTGAAAALTLTNQGGAQNTTFSGSFNATTAANLTLTKTGGGTLTIASSTPGNATGAWTLNAGAVNVDFSASGLNSNTLTSRNMTLSGGTLQITGRSGATVTQALGTITIGARGGQIIMTPNGGTSTTLNLGAMAHPTTAGASLLINAPASTTVTTTTTTLSNSIFGGRYVFTNGTGFDWATNGGVAANPITGLASYTTLATTGGGDFNNSLLTGSATLTGSRSTNSLKIAPSGSGQALNLGTHDFALESGGLLFTGSQDYAINATTGVLSSNSLTTGDLVIHQYGTGLLTINAGIEDGASGVTALTKVGTGTLALGGSNTFTGAVFVNAGALSVSNVNQLGNAAGATAITINDGATFQTTANMTIAGSGAQSHNFSLTGGNATFDIANGTTLGVAGVISGAGGLTLNNTGTLQITTAATYTGPTFVNAGTLLGGVTAFINAGTGGNLNVASSALVNMNDFTLTVGGIAGAGNIVNNNATAARVLTVGGNNQNTTYSGVLQATGTASQLALTKNGTGVLTLTNNNLYTGATLLTNGTIKFGVNNALANTAVTLGNAAGPVTALLDLDGKNWNSAAITFYGTTSTATSQAAVNIGSGGTLTLGGNVTATVNATASNGFLGAFITGGTLDLGSATRTFNIADSINAAADLTVTSAITSAAGAFGITKSGAGTLLLTGANTYAGTTTIQAGTLMFAGNGTLGNGTGALTFSTGTSTLDLNGTNQVVGNLSGTIAGVKIRNSATGTNSRLTVGNGASTLGNVSYIGDLEDGGGTLALTKSGAGYLTLSGANTYTGGTIINDGLLNFANTAAKPAAGNIVAGAGAGLGLAVGGSGFFSTSDVDALFANTMAGVSMHPTSVVGIDTTQGDLTYSTIPAASTNGLAKLGTNTLFILGNNTFTGTTSVAGGILSVANDSTWSSSTSGLSINGATLQLTGNSNTALNGSASLILGPSGGTFDIVNAASRFAISQNFSGTGALTKSGAGMLTLSGDATNTGAYAVANGVLRVTGNVNNGAGTTSIGNVASSRATLYAGNGSDYRTTTFSIGNDASGTGSLVIAGGDVAATTTNTAAGVLMANPTSGSAYGGFYMSGGSFATQRFDMGSATATGTAVAQITGGTFNWTEYILARTTRWDFTITGGQAVRTGTGNVISLGEVNSSFGAMTVAGGLLDNSGQNVTFGRVVSTATSSLNLNSGTLVTNAFTVTPANFTNAYLNFNGGTLKANIDSTTFMPTGFNDPKAAVYVNGAFSSFTGGAFIDSNGRNITAVANLLAPTGNGVTSLSSGLAGSGYIGVPYVEITGGGGTGATGYATVDLDPLSPTYGQVTGVFVTNPGVGYTSAPTVTLVGGGGSGATASASIGANSSGGLTKLGTGSLTLSGTNTYTGGTTVSQGLLNFANTAARPTTGAISVGAGAGLGLAMGAFNYGDIDALFRNSMPGVSMNATSVVGIDTSAGDFTYSTSQTGTKGLAKSGANTLNLTGNNSYTGPTTIYGGSLFGSIGNGNIVLSGGTYETSGTFSLPLGTGNNQVRWEPGQSGGFAARGGALTVSIGGGVPLEWDSTPHFISGAGQQLLNSTTADEVVTFTNDIDLGSNVTRTIQVLDNTNLTTDKAVISGNLTGTNVALTKSGAGVLELTGNNSWDGNTSVTGGTLIFHTLANLGNTPRINMGTGTTATVLQFNGNSNVDMGLGLTINAAGTTGGVTIRSDGLGALTVRALDFTGGSDANAKTITLRGTSTAVNTIDAVIRNNNAWVGGAGITSLTKTDAGTWRLTKVNTHTGTTSITGGTLLLGIANAIAASPTTVNAATAVLDLGGFAHDHGANQVTLTNGQIINGTLTSSATNFNLVLGTVSAALSGTAGVNKTGTGVVTLSGNNTYSGVNLLTNGTISVANIGSVGSTSSNLGSQSTAATAKLVMGTGATDGVLTYTGDGESTNRSIELGGSSTGGGRINNDGTGALTFTGGFAVANGGGAKTFTLGGTYVGGDNVFTAAIVDFDGTNATNLTKTGVGTWVLQGNNSHTGLTTVNDGTLKFNGNSTIGALSMGGGTGTTAAASIEIASGRTLATTGITYVATNNNQTAVIRGAGTLNIGANPTVTVNDSTTAAVDMSWEMNTLTGSGTFSKAGAGTLNIRGITNNNFSGSYQINAGAILGLDTVTNNIVLNGGVFEGNGSFTRGLGAGNNQVQWAAGTGGGGFAASGGNLTVTMAGAPDPLVWGTTALFVGTGAPLIFGSSSADSIVDFTHNINLNGAQRTVQVNDNTATLNDVAVLSGVLSSATGSLIKTGTGVLALTNQNNSYGGGTTISAGTLALQNINNLAAGNSAVGTGSITLGAGRLAFVGDTSQSTDRLVSITGAATLDASGTGGAVIDFTRALDLASDLQLVLDGTGVGVLSGGAITIAGGAPATSAAADLTKNGTGTWILASTNAFTLDDIFINAGILRVAADNVFGTTVGNAAAGADDMTIAAAGTLDMQANAIIDAVTINGGSITGSGSAGQNVLTVTSITATGTTSLVSGNIGLTTGRTFGVANANDLLTVSGGISGAGGITKTGAGTVLLTGSSINTGATTISAGQVRVDASGSALGNSASNSVVFNGPRAELYLRSSETINTLTLTIGNGVLTLDPHAGGQTQLTVNSAFSRNANSTLLIRGDNVGGTGADSSRVLFSATAAPSLSLIGGGGSLGSQTASIVPYFVGGTTVNDFGSTFITTYNAGGGMTGLRTLADNEFFSLNGNVSSTPSRFVNASVDGNTNVLDDLRVNSIRFMGDTTTIASGKNVVVGSGAALFADSATVTGGTLNFDGQQAVITVAGSSQTVATIDSRVRAAAGLFVGASGDPTNTLVLGGTNNMIDGTVLVSGTLRAGSDTALNPYRAPVVTLALNNSVLQAGGNDVRVRTLTSSATGTAGGIIENADASAGTIRVYGTSTFSGLFRNGTGGGVLNLVKEGAGTLTLDVGNSTYTGSTTIRQGQITLSGNAGRLTGTTAVNISGSGVLRLQNTTGTSNSTDRLSTGAITLSAGRLEMSATTETTTETMGSLTIGAGQSVVRQTTADTGFLSTMTFASLARAPGEGGVVLFTNIADADDQVLGSSNRIETRFTTAPALTNGILPWAVVSFNPNTAVLGSVDFATHSGNATTVRAFSTYDTAAPSGWTSTTVAAPTVTTLSSVVGSNADVYALKLTNNLDLAAKTLNIYGGGLIYNGAAGGLISNGTLTAGGNVAGDLTIFVEDNLTAAKTLTISSLIADNATGAVSLTKAGADTLVLSNTGNNTFTGRTSVFDGVLSINKDRQLGLAPTTFTEGHLRLYGSPSFTGQSTASATTLAITSSMTLDSNRGIEIGGGAVTIDAAGQTLTYGGRITGNQVTDLNLIGDMRFTLSGSSTVGGLLTLQGQGTTANTNFIALGGTQNTIGGGLVVGVGSTASRFATLSYAVNGGALSLGSNRPGIDNLDIGVRTVDSGATNITTRGLVDLRGSSNFTAYVNDVRLGVITSTASQTGATAQGELYLATNSEIYAANSILVGQTTTGNNTNNSGVTSRIEFGAGNSLVTTPLFVVGDSRSTGVVTLGTNGTLTVQGVAANTGNLIVGRRTIATNNNTQPSSGTFTVSGGTFIADLNQLIVGQRTSADTGTSNSDVTGVLTTGTSANSRVVVNSLLLGSRENAGASTGGTISGTMTFAGGTMNVLGDATIGNNAATNGSDAGHATAVWNINGGAATVNGTLLLARRTTTGTGNSTGTVNLNGGTLRFGTLTRGTGTGTTATLSVGDAVLGGLLDANSINTNMTVNLTNANSRFDTPDGFTTTFQSTASFTGVGRLNKTGSGTLILQGASDHTGGTTINGGLVSVSANNALGAVSGSLTFNGGGLQALQSFTLARNVSLAGAGRIDVADTMVLTVPGGANSFSGAGSLQKTGEGTLRFAAGSGYSSGAIVIDDGILEILGTYNATGDATINAGEMIIGNTGAYNGTGRVIVNDGAILSLLASGTLNAAMGVLVSDGGTFNQSGNHTSNGDVVVDSGTTTVSGTYAVQGSISVGNNGTMTVTNGGSISTTTGVTVQSGGNLNVAGTLTNTAGGTNVSTGAIVVAGTYNNTGGTTITNGSITVDNGANYNDTGSVTVGFNSTLDVNGTLNSSGGVFVDAGGVLSGSGTIIDDVTLNAGSRASVGNSPGKMTIQGNSTWNGSTVIDGVPIQDFEINNVDGVFATNWDYWDITGTLTISATPTSTIMIDINSLTLANTPGDAGFDPFTNYSWLWVTAAGGITHAGGLLDDIFTFNTDDLVNFNGSMGKFSVMSNVGNTTLSINYTAVPEPGSWLLCGLAAAGLGAYGWRRRRARLAA